MGLGVQQDTGPYACRCLRKTRLSLAVVAVAGVFVLCGCCAVSVPGFSPRKGQLRSPMVSVVTVHYPTVTHVCTHHSMQALSLFGDRRWHVEAQHVVQRTRFDRVGSKSGMLPAIPSFDPLPVHIRTAVIRRGLGPEHPEPQHCENSFHFSLHPFEPQYTNFPPPVAGFAPYCTANKVIGLARMIMSQGLPVRLRVMVPAVENAIDGGDKFTVFIVPSMLSRIRVHFHLPCVTSLAYVRGPLGTPKHAQPLQVMLSGSSTSSRGPSRRS